MDLPLISVIVPIYNVAPYLRKCLNSLKAQSLKKIEVICIDDGSTDESGQIADEYKSSVFPIFRIFHDKNRGLSAARNRGLDEAWAEWIMFVDSDDWVAPDFCRIPYEAVIENNANLVTFRAFNSAREGKRKSLEQASFPIGVVDKSTAHRFSGPVAWNKIYGKELFNGIRYPEGHVYEDLATTYKLIDASEKIVSLPDRLYYPVKRKGSITHTDKPEYKRDRFKATLDRYDFLIASGYHGNELETSLYGAAIAYLANSFSPDDEMYRKAVDQVNGINRIPKNLSFKQKIGIYVWKKNKGLFEIITRLNKHFG